MRKVLKRLAYLAVFMITFAGVTRSVEATNKSVITGVKAAEITVGTSFNAKNNVAAYDAKGKNITKKIKITGTVNTNVKGVYYYTYKVKVTSDRTITKKRKITVKAKSYKLKKSARQFDVKSGYGRHAILSAGSKVTLVEKSSSWYKTSKGYWLKEGFKGDYIYIGKDTKIYKTATSASSTKKATYGIQKVIGTSNKKKRVKIAEGWISSPSFLEQYESKGVAAQQNEILALVNKERKAKGLNLLKLDETLSKLAIIRSVDMVEHQYFAHVSPKYGAFDNLVQQSNYSYVLLGENIAAGSASAKQYMSLWMNSSGHRANILNKKYERIGIGVVKNTKGGFYSSVATQIFSKK